MIDQQQMLLAPPIALNKNKSVRFMALQPEIVDDSELNNRSPERGTDEKNKRHKISQNYH